MELSSPRIIFNLSYHAEQPSKNWNEQRQTEYQKERDFYACKTSNENILDYCIRSCDENAKNEYDKNAEANIMDYATRAGQAEDRRFAAFSESGELSKHELEEMKFSLQVTKSNIWHGVISFEEMFGNNSMQNKQVAQEFVQSQMKRFLSQTHLDSKNVAWFAAHHADTSNKHIHIVFFEKEPKRIDRNGNCGYTSKGMIDKNAILNSLLNFDEYFSQNKKDVFSMRDCLIEQAKSVKELIGTDSTFFQGIGALAKELPRSGRLSYQSENMKEQIPRVDKLVVQLLDGKPEIKNAYIGFMNAATDRQKRYEEYAKENKLKGEEIKLEQFGKLHSDINARLGNLIIDMAKEHRHKEEKAQREINVEKCRIEKMEKLDKMARRRKQFSQAKKKSKQARGAVLKTLKRMLSPTNNATDYFKAFHERLEEIAREQEMQGHNKE